MDDLPLLVSDLLDLIKQRSGFGLVMLTRVRGEDWDVVSASANPYGIVAGDTFRWSDSICSRMVGRDGAGWLLDDVDTDAAAVDAPVRDRLDIAAYAGAPLHGADGQLVGTLCAIDPEGRDTASVADLFDFAGRFGAYALGVEAARHRAEREAERRLFRTGASGATLLPSEVWQGLLDREHERTRWTGEDLTVGLLRVAGSEQHRRSQLDHVLGTLVARLGSDDVLTVLGSNRVGILCVGREPAALEAELDRIAVDFEIASAVSAVAGASAADTATLLEQELVGAGAAAARTKTQLVQYSFCAECGRKGVYRSLVADVVRCKYCGALEQSLTTTV